MTFAELANFLEKLEVTSSRNEITRILADLFKRSNKDEIDKICYLLLGRIAPQYEGTEFQLAEKMVMRALSLAYKTDVGDVLKGYKRAGDIGDIAQELAKSKVKSQKAKLSVGETFDLLKEIALEGGGGSQERKLEKMAGLLARLDPLSAKYIARIPIGNLRLGFSDITMLDALSYVVKGDKSARKGIEAAYNVTADIGKIARTVKESGLSGIARIKPIPGVPIRGSLAERLASAEKVVEKMDGKFAVEPKFDGLRVQAHVWTDEGGRRMKSGGKQVKIFSRNLENVTHMFPEIVEAAKKLSVESVIFDGEAIGYNPKTGKFSPFQETVQRKRKHGIEQMAIDMPLKVFVFDVLYLNGESLIDKPFWQRRRVLETKLKLSGNTIVLTDQEIVDSAKRLREMTDQYIKEGLEGSMAKRLGVAYQAGGRGFHWVKFKRHTENIKGLGSKVADTIDCVLMGAYFGKGKRTQFGVGGFLIGVPGKGGKYYTLTNLGTGLTDEQFRQMYKLVQKLKVNGQPGDFVVDKLVVPDIWVKPGVVLEILADEITLSPRHTAGRDIDKDKGRGYSLRFPRLIRVRDDKNTDQATSVHEVKELYKMQSSKS